MYEHEAVEVAEEYLREGQQARGWVSDLVKQEEQAVTGILKLERQNPGRTAFKALKLVNLGLMGFGVEWRTRLHKGGSSFKAVFSHNHPNLEAVQVRTGVISPNSLFVGIITEPEDREQLEAYLMRQTFGARRIWDQLLGTEYFADKSGNSRKISCLPEQMDFKGISLDVLHYQGVSIRLVRSEMTPRDLITARFVLDDLSEAILSE